MASDLLFYGHFIASKVGKTSLADVTVDIDKIEKSTGTRTAVVTAGAATEGRRGYYLYRLANATPLTHDYVAIFMTADSSVDQQQVAAVRIDFAEAQAAALAYLDAAVSSRLAAASYSAAPSAADVADEVASIDPADYGVGTAAYAWAAAGSAADPLLNAVPGLYPSGTGGYALGRIASGLLTVVQAVLADGFVRIVGGSTYKASIGTAIDVSSDGGWPSLPADVAIKWVFGDTQSAGSRVDSDTVRLELTAAQSAALLAAYPGRRTYDITATWTTGEVFFLANEAPCLIE